MTSMNRFFLAEPWLLGSGRGLFGYYPARKAAALNPIEALRYE